MGRWWVFILILMPMVADARTIGLQQIQDPCRQTMWGHECKLKKNGNGIEKDPASPDTIFVKVVSDRVSTEYDAEALKVVTDTDWFPKGSGIENAVREVRWICPSRQSSRRPLAQMQLILPDPAERKAGLRSVIEIPCSFDAKQVRVGMRNLVAILSGVDLVVQVISGKAFAPLEGAMVRCGVGISMGVGIHQSGKTGALIPQQGPFAGLDLSTPLTKADATARILELRRRITSQLQMCPSEECKSCPSVDLAACRSALMQFEPALKNLGVLFGEDDFYVHGNRFGPASEYADSTDPIEHLVRELTFQADRAAAAKVDADRENKTVPSASRAQWEQVLRWANDPQAGQKNPCKLDLDCWTRTYYVQELYRRATDADSRDTEKKPIFSLDAQGNPTVQFEK